MTSTGSNLSTPTGPVQVIFVVIAVGFIAAAVISLGVEFVRRYRAGHGGA